jgi:hypothetical protein
MPTPQESLSKWEQACKNAYAEQPDLKKPLVTIASLIVAGDELAEMTEALMMETLRLRMLLKDPGTNRRQ